MDFLGEFVFPLIPPLLVGGLFWVIMRSILRADSKERQVYAELEAQMRAEQGKAVSEQAPKKAK